METKAASSVVKDIVICTESIKEATELIDGCDKALKGNYKVSKLG